MTNKGTVKTEIHFPEITDKKFIDECVNLHNKHRSSVNPQASNMRHMTWDEALAVTARAWARKCVFEHNIYLGETKRVHPIYTSVGENIWAGAPPAHFSVETAINSWMKEVKYYTYDSHSCTRVCGHYTQVVWADSYKVGCAVQVCPDGVSKTTFSSKKGVIFVCDYATGGNYNGVKPYKTGKSCSACMDDTCQDKLCYNPERDRLKRYNWRPDWDPDLASCDSFCKAVLAIRPITLALTFISVYCLQIHYPDLFAYE
ncbi:GLIPR1-like protein 1 [Chanos chanos]|uniref:GLIPR1-like protein 1 n=1 Tax=Chanos chanos TaxID=29144 RepID=A0A6J2VPS4_CHACN|nr:glioma pathogenesis-related protein 1 [Chanos chanos]